MIILLVVNKLLCTVIIHQAFAVKFFISNIAFLYYDPYWSKAAAFFSVFVSVAVLPAVIMNYWLVSTVVCQWIYNCHSNQKWLVNTNIYLVINLPLSFSHIHMASHCHKLLRCSLLIMPFLWQGENKMASMYVRHVLFFYVHDICIPRQDKFVLRLFIPQLYLLSYFVGCMSCFGCLKLQTMVTSRSFRCCQTFDLNTCMLYLICCTTDAPM